MASFLDTMFGGGAEREAAEKNRALAAQYQTSSLDALKSAYGTSTDYGTKAVGAYDPLVGLATKYGKAGDLYLDALGVNGPEGVARATAGFQTTPGYKLTEAAGLEALDRRRAIGGMYGSGNRSTDIMDYITKSLYGTQYAPWLANLQGAGAQGGQYATTAAGGQAAGWGNLAGLAERYGGNQTGVFGNFMNTNIAANNQQAAGEAMGAKNLLGAGLNLATAAMGMPGAGSMFSGMGSNLFASTPTGPTTGGYGPQGQALIGSGTYGGIRYPAV